MMHVWLKVFLFNILFSLLFLFGIILEWIDPNTEFIQNLCIVLLLSLGLLHGCNDLSLLRQKALKKYKNMPVKLSAYIAIILLMLSLLFYTREIGILVFLIISAYHFGEEILESLFKRKNRISYLLYAMYGINLFTLLFLGSYDELHKVLENFALSNFTYEVLKSITLLLLGVTGIIMFLYVLYGYLSFKRFLLSMGLLIIIFTTSLLTNLLLAFTLIFVLFHSIPSILSQISVINKNSFSYDLKEFLKRSVVIYLLSLALLYLGYLYRDQFQSGDIILFILAAVTIPHILLIALQKTNAG